MAADMVVRHATGGLRQGEQQHRRDGMHLAVWVRALVSRYSSDEMKRLEGQGRPAEETRSMPQTG